VTARVAGAIEETVLFGVGVTEAEVRLAEIVGSEQFSTYTPQPNDLGSSIRFVLRAVASAGRAG